MAREPTPNHQAAWANPTGLPDLWKINLRLSLLKGIALVMSKALNDQNHGILDISLLLKASFIEYLHRFHCYKKIGQCHLDSHLHTEIDTDTPQVTERYIPLSLSQRHTSCCRLSLLWLKLGISFPAQSLLNLRPWRLDGEVGCLFHPRVWCFVICTQVPCGFEEKSLACSSRFSWPGPPVCKSFAWETDLFDL